MFLLKSFLSKSFNPKSWEFGPAMAVKPLVELLGGGGDLRKKKRKNEHASDYDYLNPVPRKQYAEPLKKYTAPAPVAASAPAIVEYDPTIGRIIRAVESNTALWEQFYSQISVPNDEIRRDIFKEDEEMLLFLL